jgi:hypothetical protein
LPDGWPEPSACACRFAGSGVPVPAGGAVGALTPGAGPVVDGGVPPMACAGVPVVCAGCGACVATGDCGGGTFAETGGADGTPLAATGAPDWGGAAWGVAAWVAADCGGTGWEGIGRGRAADDGGVAVAPCPPVGGRLEAVCTARATRSDRTAAVDVAVLEPLA